MFILHTCADLPSANHVHGDPRQVAAHSNPKQMYEQSVNGKCKHDDSISTLDAMFGGLVKSCVRAE